jgi:2,5-furandicarboxylate decarboxylase 1
MTDLRHYLARCRHKIEIRKVVNCAHEVPAILAALEARGNFDAVLFHSVVNNNGIVGAYSVLVNLFARRDAIATMLAAADLRDFDGFNQRVATNGTLDVVGEAPVRETIIEGDEIDLNSIPIVTHHERDAGPYITSGIVVVKDPETGIYNAAIQRLFVHDRTTLGIFMVPTGHNKMVQQKYAAAGRDMPVAVVIGHHPLFYFGAQTKEPIDRDEYRIAASLMGGTLRLTRCSTFPELLVPADAELVLEGVMPAQGRRLEGPFGEYSHYYCAPEQREYINVTTILHRRDPIFLDIFACHRDHHLLEGTLMTAQLTQVMRAQYPEFVRLSLPLSGCCQLYCYVAFNSRPGLDLREVGLYILRAQEFIKYVVFVDEDIDVDDESTVLWAIATRATLSDDVLLTRATCGTLMDPTAKGKDCPERGVIDATAKDPAMLANRVRVKPDVLEKFNLDNYLEPQR